MTVDELITILSQYDKNIQVQVVCGSDDWGGWGFLKIGQDEYLKSREYEF